MALGLTYGWHAELRTLVMAALANGLKLTGLIEGSRRRLAWALVLAITLSIIASTLVTLASAYEHGGVNIIGPGAGMVAARDLTRFITMNRFGPQLDAWLFMGLGGGAMSLLMWARHRFLWWPLSPEGFVIGPNWKTSHIFFSAFVACSSSLSSSNSEARSCTAACGRFFW